MRYLKRKRNVNAIEWSEDQVENEETPVER